MINRPLCSLAFCKFLENNGKRNRVKSTNLFVNNNLQKEYNFIDVMDYCLDEWSNLGFNFLNQLFDTVPSLSVNFQTAILTNLHDWLLNKLPVVREVFLCQVLCFPF